MSFTNARYGAKILDVATGTGKQAFAFAKKGYDVIGIDLSEEMLKVADKKNKYENVRFEVADAFDAMTSDRPYRNKLSLEQALDELEKCSGTQFDPNVVKALKRVNSLQRKRRDEKIF